MMPKVNWRHLWNTLTTPQAIDADEARREYMTRVISLIMAIVAFGAMLIFVSGWMLGFLPLDSVFVTLGMTLAFGSACWLTYRGHWRAGGYIPPAVVFLTAVYGNWIGGAGAPTMVLYAVAIVLTAILQSEGAQWVTLVLSIAAYLGIGEALLSGYIVQLRFPETAFANRVVIVGGVYIGLASLLWFLTNQFRRALTQAHVYSKRLAVTNQQLEQEIIVHKQVDESLRQSNETLQALIDCSPLAIVKFDLDGQVLLWNHAAEKLYGWTPAETLGKFVPMVAEKHLPEYQALRARLLKGETLTNLEVERQRKDGSPVLINLSMAPLRDAQGTITAFMSIVADITESQKAKVALRESEEKYKLLIETTNTGYVILNEQGQVMDANQEYVRLTGHLNLEEIVGKSVTEWTAKHDQERNAAAVRTCVAQGFVHNLEIDYVHPGGRIIPVEINATAWQMAGSLKIQSLCRDITERKQAEEALRESEKQYRSVTENIQDVFYRSDIHGRLLMGSPSGARLFGYDTVSEMIGLPLDSFWPDPGERERLLAQVKATGSVKDFEAVLKKKDGAAFNASFTTHFYYDEHGNLLGIEGIIRDITERKQAEAALRESEERYRHLFESSPESITLINLDGTILECNEVTAEIAGMPRDEIIGKPFLELGVLDERELPQYLELFARILDGESVGPLQLGTIRNRDETRWVEVFIASLKKDGAVYAFQIITRDITERKQAEETLKRYAEQAQRRAEQLATMNEIGHAVSTLRNLASVLEIIYHQVRRIALVDAFYVSLYDPDRNQVSFPLVYDLGVRYQEPTIPLGPDTWLAQVIGTGRPFMLHRTAEQLQEWDDHGLGDRTRRSAAVLIVPLWLGERVLGVLSVQSYTLNAYTDEIAEILTGIGHQAAIAIENARLYEQAQQEILERRQMQAEREKLIVELEAKNAELERFTYTVSHDLKAPLITIRGFLGFLEKDALAGNWERLKDDAAHIVAATDKMQRLLGELLELSRIGRMMNPPQVVPFETIVREALELASGRLQERGVKVDIASDLPTVYGDRARLVEVVQNLVDNAAKFMGGQAEPCIAIGQRGTDEQGRSTLFVRDNGIGIEPQYHTQVFGLFNKLDAQTDGTGVGLALVKRIVEVHGGRIWVESELGQGTTFYFTLPVRDR